MTAFVVWAIVAVYLSAGVVYARARIQRWSRTSTLLDHNDGFDRGMFAMLAVLVGLVWPLALAWSGVATFLWRPADRDAARLARLEADLRAWRSKRHQGTEAEQQMAVDIVATLEELLGTRKTGTR